MNKSEKKYTETDRKKEMAIQTLRKSSYTGKTPKQIMTRHMRDKNDVITEEDFKNLNISIDISNDTAPAPLEIPDDNERPKDEDKDPVVVTSWDVIG